MKTEERKNDWVTVAVDMPPGLRDKLSRVAAQQLISRQALMRRILAATVGWEQEQEEGVAP